MFRAYLSLSVRFPGSPFFRFRNVIRQPCDRVQKSRISCSLTPRISGFRGARTFLSSFFLFQFGNGRKRPENRSETICSCARGFKSRVSSPFFVTSPPDAHGGRGGSIKSLLEGGEEHCVYSRRELTRIKRLRFFIHFISTFARPYFNLSLLLLLFLLLL